MASKFAKKAAFLRHLCLNLSIRIEKILGRNRFLQKTVMWKF
jgi:hypothetical protein